MTRIAKLPQDCTKRQLAELIELRARMMCRDAVTHADGSKTSVPVTRTTLLEARSAIMGTPRYRDLDWDVWPSMITIVNACKRRHDPELDTLDLRMGS